MKSWWGVGWHFQEKVQPVRKSSGLWSERWIRGQWRENTLMRLECPGEGGGAGQQNCTDGEAGLSGQQAALGGQTRGRMRWLLHEEYPVLRVQTREPPVIPPLSVCRCGIKRELKLWARFQRLSCHQRIHIQKHEPLQQQWGPLRSSWSVSEVSSVLRPGKEGRGKITFLCHFSESRSESQWKWLKMPPFGRWATVSAAGTECARLPSRVRLLATPGTAAHQAPLSLASPDENTGVGSHSLLQGIFPTRESNPGASYTGRQVLRADPLGSEGLSTVSWKERCTFAPGYIQALCWDGTPQHSGQAIWLPIIFLPGLPSPWQCGSPLPGRMQTTVWGTFCAHFQRSILQYKIKNVHWNILLLLLNC